MAILEDSQSVNPPQLGSFTTRDKVAIAMRDWIKAGKWPAGQALPSGRRLTHLLGANRPAVRGAVQLLVSEGLLVVEGRTARVQGDADPLIARSMVVVGAPPQMDAGDLSHGWANAITSGAIEAVAKHGLNAIAPHPDRIDESVITGLQKGRPYGVVLTDCGYGHELKREMLNRLAEIGIRIAIYSGGSEWSDYDCVHSDHEAGAYELTKWLIANGRRRIAHLFVRPKSSYWTKARFQGYQRAMTEAGLQPLPLISAEGVTSVSAQDGSIERFDVFRHLFTGYLAPRLLGNAPLDAILTESDGQVYPLAAACRALGREPGKDVWLTGYDNYYAACGERAYESCGPQATMDKRNPEMGAELVRIIIDRAEGRLTGPPVSRKFMPQLIVPGSN